MLLDIRFRLETPMLGGGKKDNRQVRRIRRFGGGIHVNKTDWQDKMDLAAKQLHYLVDIHNTVHPPESFRPARIHIYRRVFNGSNIEFFESFEKGQVLTIEFLIREDLPKHPTPEQLRAVLKLVGKRMGFSQFGSKFGFGRFSLESIAPKDPAYHEEKTSL